MKNYELYLVIDADAQEAQVSAIVEKVSQLISAGYGGVSGEVAKVEARGKRHLAYDIKRKSDSQDIVLNFRTPAPALVELERVLKLDELVLRYQIIRLDKE